jgi:hypothetical protein
MSDAARSVHWTLRPFVFLGQLAAWLIEVLGRFLVVVIGLALMAAGAVLCLTLIGAVIGIPLFVVGLLLVIRGIF